MSERKVLNKYYPPDFDPSKIPRSKVARNKTFTIRLMAPCNMRCTTCGEYIYKGRKFNARKEDVEDQTHLGLRIYRFYIKCTACLSEISFRTDPQNTDYVLEAGATRNFEALAKAEKQAEMEAKAYQEELKSNPMKLLEERTAASKSEMERMENLEELKELNKREAKVNYEALLGNYEKIRREKAQAQENEDEKFIKQIFGNSDEKKIKRILDDDDDDEPSSSSKISKVEKVTDHLISNTKSSSSSSSDVKKESWEKSIGSLSSLKSLKSGIVVKKKTSSSTSTSNQVEKLNQVKKSVEESKPKGLLVGLIGDYSDSNDEDSN